ncbi:uncharacterized protein DS421_20g703720 [Arachis hypogaea]|nr:uncharacterized protein DS421_20g703720 [Arachis hypogaea]
MSSSEPTSNEVPNERTPEVGGENVESVVRSSTDSGALTKPPPHPRSKKRKVDSTNVGATSGATPTNPAPSNVDTDEEDGKDEANEGNRKPSRPRSWTWEHFTKDPKSKPSHPRAKFEALICTQNWLRASPMTTDFEELIGEFEKLELEIAPTGEDEDESGVDSD